MSRFVESEVPKRLVCNVCGVGLLLWGKPDAEDLACECGGVRVEEE